MIAPDLVAHPCSTGTWEAEVLATLGFEKGTASKRYQREATKKTLRDSLGRETKCFAEVLKKHKNWLVDSKCDIIVLYKVMQNN